MNETALLLLQRWGVWSDAMGPHVGQELVGDLCQSLTSLGKRIKTSLVLATDISRGSNPAFIAWSMNTTKPEWRAGK